MPITRPDKPCDDCNHTIPFTEQVRVYAGILCTDCARAHFQRSGNGTPLVPTVEREWRARLKETLADPDDGITLDEALAYFKKTEEPAFYARCLTETLSDAELVAALAYAVAPGVHEDPFFPDRPRKADFTPQELARFAHSITLWIIATLERKVA
jgi:hypothetical protein